MPTEKEIDEILKVTKWDTVMYYMWWGWINYLRELPRRIKWFFQRGIRGYSDRDMWSIDFYLCTIIPKMLREFRSNLTGYPGNITQKKWEDILGKIIYAFEMHRKIDGLEITPTKKQMEEVDEGLKLFIKWFPNLWD